MEKCEICGCKLKNISGLSSHIRQKHKIKSKEYFDVYFKIDGDGICPICNNPTPFLGFGKGYQETCSLKCGTIKSDSKRRKTNLYKYGVSNGHGVEVVNKIKTNNITKYGVENISQLESVKKKKEHIFLEKYGVSNNFQRVEVREKAKSKESTEKRLTSFRDTCLEKYGVEHPFKSNIFVNELINTKKINTEEFETNNDCVSVQTLLIEYGTGWYQHKIISEYLHLGKKIFVKTSDIPLIQDYVKTTHGTSHIEKEILDYISTFYRGDTMENSRKIIPPYEIDIYIPQKRLAIEVNGNYWHSDKAGKPRDYHFNKSRMCEESGIRLIHIYETEWLEQKDKIKQLLSIALVNNKIQAKDCVIKEITNSEAKVFNENNHLQGHKNAQVSYGLLYNNKLVQLISFNTVKEPYSWEIVRNSLGDYYIGGGTNTLFLHFIEKYNPNIIYASCDYNKLNGKEYEEAGMKFMGYSNPNKWFVINHRISNKKSGRIEGIIWGSGSKKYEWRKV